MNIEEMLGINPNDELDRRARIQWENDHNLLADLIAARKRAGMSQLQVADAMGVSQSAVARVEGGDRDPRLSTLRRYAMAVAVLIEHKVKDDSQRDLVPGYTTIETTTTEPGTNLVWDRPGGSPYTLLLHNVPAKMRIGTLTAAVLKAEKFPLLEEES